MYLVLWNQGLSTHLTCIMDWPSGSSIVGGLQLGSNPKSGAILELFSPIVDSVVLVYILHSTPSKPKARSL